MAASDLSLEESSDGILWIRLSGSWKIGDALPSSSEVASAVEGSTDLRGIAFDASGITAWDSGLLTFLRRVLRECAGRQLDTDREGLPDGVRRLLDLADAVPEQETGTHSEPPGFLGRIGEQVIDSLGGIRELLEFTGNCTIAFGRLATGRSRFPFSSFMLVLQDCGPRALGIVSLVSLLVGLILAFMGAIQLSNFGAEIFVADLVAIGMTRDMGPIMVGIIMAGRTGAAFAAELGTMTVNEEIDALETMGISAMDYLVMPRMLALMLMMPLLTIYGDLLGILGGMLVGVTSLDLGALQYTNRTLDALSMNHILTGLFKGTVYGVIVALAGCMRGMQCGRSAEAVGTATTSAVVMSIIGIILACGALTIVFNVIGI